MKTETKQKLQSKKESIRSVLRELNYVNFIFLTLAGIMNAFAVTVFFNGVKLYDSGISGLSMLLDRITPPYLTLSIFLLVLNIPIFIFGMKRQGTAFTIYSVYTVAIFSLVSFLIPTLLPMDISQASPLVGTDVLLCAVFGGAICGIGSGITIRFGGAIDGIDVLSVIFAKKIGISIGSFVLIFNTVLYIICGFVMHNWILPLYSIIAYFIGSKCMDFIVEGLNRVKCAMIITTKASEISDALSDAFKASGTIVNAIGGYTKQQKEMLYFMINHFQINHLKKIVYRIDKDAFIAIQEVSDIIKKQKRER